MTSPHSGIAPALASSHDAVTAADARDAAMGITVIQARDLAQSVLADYPTILKSDRPIRSLYVHMRSRYVVQAKAVLGPVTAAMLERAAEDEIEEQMEAKRLLDADATGSTAGAERVLREAGRLR